MSRTIKEKIPVILFFATIAFYISLSFFAGIIPGLITIMTIICLFGLLYYAVS